MNRSRWLDLFRRLGCGSAEARFEDVRAAYDEAHRHYHTGRHITECLALFDELRDLCERPDEVEIAIWLHDVVYRPRRRDNETRSAELAARWLAESSLGDAGVERVRALIVATRHADVPRTGDEGVLVDVDLHILGTPAERFDEYEAQVRAEYRWVPRVLFERRRANVLRGFLSREPLYHTGRCRDRFEAPARRNLQRSLARLGALS